MRTTKIVPATTLRNNLSDTLDDVEAQHSIYIINRRGHMRSALVDLDLLEDLLELHDQDYLASIQQARAEAKAGQLASFEDVFGKL